MAVDLPVDLFYATVRISQQLPDGKFGQGTGFLISAPTPDGAPRVVMVTADHVFSAKMLGDEVKIGLRQQDVAGRWRYAPQPLRIRYAGTQLWTRHPVRDVAVITVQVPPEVARAAIPLSWLAEADVFDRYGVRGGDTMMTIGFPIGLSSTPEGFPILRTGVLASYPVSPLAAYPTFLLDAPIYSGNSGGPVFVAKAGAQFIAGIVTQQVESEGRALDLGIITHAAFVRETIAQLDAPAAPIPPSALVPGPGAPAY
jgi:S1-C subfamily serine protease